jgi:hypothetical protein
LCDIHHHDFVDHLSGQVTRSALVGQPQAVPADSFRVEDAYRRARDLADRLEIAEVRGVADDELRFRSAAATAALRAHSMENDEANEHDEAYQPADHDGDGDECDERSLHARRRYAVR